ncbi:MAG: ABC transporter substrate-binding protein [Treponema sp.]|nr:ABC transporter substrate-binding protein [Treponema sp.]
MRKKNKKIFCLSLLSLMFISCHKQEDLTLEQIDELIKNLDSQLIENTISRPYKNQKYENGLAGGVWNDTILSDPKTFNQLIAERDGASSDLINNTVDYLLDYDPVERQWKGRMADYEIETDVEKDILTVHFTIRDDAFWSYYGKEELIPVTSDDFGFWYDEIEGDPECHSGGYPSQFMVKADGTTAHIDFVKIDDKHFDFVFPRIIADPLLTTNMNCCPSFVYRPAKEKDGVEGIKKLFSVDCDPKTIPSCGMFYITEYIPARRIVLTKNPYYWEKDENGLSVPYYTKKIFQIVGDQNTDFLLFNQGKTEVYTPRPEDVNELVYNQKNGYSVYNAEGSMGASMWSFNQNPVNKDSGFYYWFTKKEFRQAMSCVLNRDRIISQTYRGLASPKYDFFPEVNPYYNPDISLEYKYNLDRAESLLKKAGFIRKEDGYFYDDKNRKVEFDLTIPSSTTVYNDIAQILVDEASKIGITITIRQTDFQKIVEMITSTYDWQSVFIALGANLFPTQGSNVWPSTGNLHLWYPLQEKPATEWEERADYLYNEGKYTLDEAAAKKIWDEYQKIFLEQCPVIYLMRSRSFLAISNKWDLSNVYYDNLNGAVLEHVFLRN